MRAEGRTQKAERRAEVRTQKAEKGQGAKGKGQKAERNFSFGI